MPSSPATRASCRCGPTTEPHPSGDPAGAGMEFRCLEPFRRWHFSFDGYGLHTANAAMQAGLAPVGLNRRFAVDLAVDFVTPAWDAHTATTVAGGRGSMHEQGWAKEHYEQLYRARGTVILGNEEVAFDGYGWRDHSQGPRGGGGGTPWGGHIITGTLYESGRGWGLSRYWTPDGTISLEGGWVAGCRRGFAPRGGHRGTPPSRTGDERRGAPDRTALARWRASHDRHDPPFPVVVDDEAAGGGQGP